ncbi:MAG: hypothetical protein JOZ61_10975 [Verrucomicrobia bacterium]|nr:hypothetical protein [Verrucomicrobiota bacterium]
MIDELTEKLKRLCEESAVRLSLRNRKDVEAAFPMLRTDLERGLADKLRSLIKSSVDEGLSTKEIWLTERQFAYQHLVSGIQDNWSGVVRALRYPIAAGTFLRPIDQECWPEAIDVARALRALHPFLATFRGRHKNVAEAAKRVIDRGFRLKITEARFEFEAGELERVTEILQNKISALGMVPFLSNILGLMALQWEPYEGMYIVPRDYTSWDRLPSIPFTFLINLAARAAVVGQDVDDPNSIWQEIIGLSRDLIGSLDLETYHQIEYTNVPREDLESWLREMALFDALFTLRQWPPRSTPVMIREFFGESRQEWMKTELGWNVADALEIYAAVNRSDAKDPVEVWRSGLLGDKITDDILNAILPKLVHVRGTVNSEYISPIGTKSNLMMRPLVEIGPDRFVAASKSLAGPALYEAIIGVLREKLPPAAAERLTGEGTHRVTSRLFKDGGLVPTFSEKEYSIDASSEGECDLVFEDKKSILFVECKAKALTTATMRGESLEALLDFARGLLASQVQALRHERLLRTLGKIKFTDGAVLEWQNREIIRLTVTLLSHSSLQNSDLFWTLFSPLLNSELTYSAGHPQGSKIDTLNKTLSKMRAEIALILNTGVHLSIIKSECASLTVGQLAVFVEGVGDLDQFLGRVRSSLTYHSFDPVFELIQRRRSGLIV